MLYFNTNLGATPILGRGSLREHQSRPGTGTGRDLLRKGSMAGKDARSPVHPCPVEGCKGERRRWDRPLCRGHWEARDTLRLLTEPQRKFILVLMAQNGFENEREMLEAVARVGRKLHPNNNMAFITRAVDVVGARCLDDLNVMHGIKLISSLQRWEWILEELEAAERTGK